MNNNRLINIINQADQEHEKFMLGMITMSDLLERLAADGWYDIDVENYPSTAYHEGVLWEFH
jgi:hypothetical protein